MQRISSSLTSFYKRVLPWLFGSVATLLALLACLLTYRHTQPSLLFLLMPAITIALAFVLSYKLMAHAVDEVWLDGDALLVKKRDEVAKIALRDVARVEAVTTMNPRRITLTLSKDSPFGGQIMFMPAIQSGHLVSGSKPDPIATELVRRIDTLRTRTS